MGLRWRKGSCHGGLGVPALFKSCFSTWTSHIRINPHQPIPPPPCRYLMAQDTDPHGGGEDCAVPQGGGRGGVEGGRGRIRLQAGPGNNVACTCYAEAASGFTLPVPSNKHYGGGGGTGDYMGVKEWGCPPGSTTTEIPTSATAIQDPQGPEFPPLSSPTPLTQRIQTTAKMIFLVLPEILLLP